MGSLVTLQVALPLEGGHGPLVPIGHQDALRPSRGAAELPSGEGAPTPPSSSEPKAPFVTDILEILSLPDKAYFSFLFFKQHKLNVTAFLVMVNYFSVFPAPQLTVGHQILN